MQAPPDEVVQVDHRDRQPRFVARHALARRLPCGPHAASVGNCAHDRRTKCLCVGRARPSGGHGRTFRPTLPQTNRTPTAAASPAVGCGCKPLSGVSRHTNISSYTPADISHTDGGGLAGRRMRLQAPPDEVVQVDHRDRQPRFVARHALARRLPCGPQGGLFPTRKHFVLRFPETFRTPTGRASKPLPDEFVQIDRRTVSQSRSAGVTSSFAACPEPSQRRQRGKSRTRR